MSTIPTPAKLLVGHETPDTAYVVEDYPYGFRLRCRIRYWLESNVKKGTRMFSQTSNPKRGHAWNKPKASTFCRFGGAMYLDEKGHVQWMGCHEYMDTAELKGWVTTFLPGLPAMMKPVLDCWITRKMDFDKAKAEGRVTCTTTVIRSDGTTTTATEKLT